MSQNLGKLLTVVVLLAMCGAGPIDAQTCDDFDECTSADTCADGQCTGTPISGGTCDDGNVCTDNDTCAAGVCTGMPVSGGTCDDGNGCTMNDTCVSGTCQGTPIENGTACGMSNCGMCMSGTCVPDLDRQEQPCTDSIGPCTTNDICLGTLCLGTPVVCADSDDDACTRDICLPATGQCQNITVECGPCSACDPETGQCGAADEGVACDDFDVCTSDTTCQGGACLGLPSGSATATVTFTPTGDMETTPTVTATGVPTGTGTATVTATMGGVGTPTFTPTEGLSTPTGTPTGTAEATATGTPTGTAAATATGTVTATGTPTGTAAATATSTVAAPTATATAPSVETSTATATRTATATNTPLPVDATIIVGSATGAPGSTVMFNVSLETSVDVAGTQNDITFDPKARITADDEGNPKCTVNPAIEKPGTTFAFQPVDCTPGTNCTGVRALVLALDNVTPIPDGSVLYTCEVQIAADATDTYALACSSPGAGDPDGNRVGADCTDGTITVASGAATIVIGDTVGAAGDFVTVEVSLQTAVQVAKTQNDIAFQPEAAVAAGNDGMPLCAVNAAINKPQTTFAFLPAGCTPATNCTGVRALVEASGNVTPIPNGATLYTCQIAIAEDAADGTYALTCSNEGALDPDGGALRATCVDGEVVVGVQPTATSTSTATRSVTDTPSPTPTGVSDATPTITPTPGTPTPPTATSTATRTATRTSARRPSNEDDGCQVVGPAARSSSAWMLILPAALLLTRRRRRR